MCLSIDVEFDALGHVILPGLIDWPARPINGTQQPDPTFIDSPRSYCAARAPAARLCGDDLSAVVPAKAGTHNPFVSGRNSATRKLLARTRRMGPRFRGYDR